MKFILLLSLFFSLYAEDMKVGYSNASLSHISKKDTIISMQIWIDEMINSSSYSASFKYYDNPSLMADDFHNNKLNFVTARGLDFVRHFNKSTLKDSFSGGMHNKDDENLVLVAPFDIDIENLLKLKNPIIAVEKNDNLAKMYIETRVFKGRKNTFLETKKRSLAILKLFFKKADLAIVVKKTFDFAKELNPQIAKELKIIKYSNIPAGVFSFFRKNFDDKLQADIKKIAFERVKSVRGKHMMRMFQSDTLVEIHVEDLKPIEKLYKEYLEIRKEKK